MVSVQRYWWLLVLFVLLGIMPVAHAVAYSVNVESIKTDIYANESASYRVVISNFEAADADFQVYTVDPMWILKTEPLGVTVPHDSQKEITLYLRPASSASYGAQGITVNFRELNSGAIVKKTIFVGLRDPGTSRPEYVVNVAPSVQADYEVHLDKQVPMRLRIDLRNSNKRNLTNLTVIVSSPHFYNQTVWNLPPDSVRTKDIEGITWSPLTPPGEAELTVQVLLDGKSVAQTSRNYRIMEYTQVKQRVKEEAFFFKTEKTIEITNEGNVNNNAIVSVPTSLVKSLFISSSLPYENEVRDGERVVFWSVPLAPYETRDFTYTENYRILVLLFLLAVISAVAYLLLRSPVVAIKEAVAIARGDGVSEIKVRVFVKNRSAKIIQGLQVTDRVPSLGEVVKHESPGSMSPTKVAVSDKQGTLLRWDLEVLEPFEERILTYQVKSKLKIIGHMKLPNAKIRFMSDNKERAVYSNNIELVEKFKDH